MQRLGCACANHDPKLSFWTGYWPGDEACRMLGVNQNELAVLVAERRPHHRYPAVH
jgi:hypothetical protein